MCRDHEEGGRRCPSASGEVRRGADRARYATQKAAPAADSQPIGGTGPAGLSIPAGHTHRSILIDRGWTRRLIEEKLSQFAVPIVAPDGVSNKAYPDHRIAEAESGPEAAARFAAVAKEEAALAARIPATGAVYNGSNTVSRAILLSRGWTAGHISRLLGDPDDTSPGRYRGSAQHFYGRDRVDIAEAQDTKLRARLAQASAKRGEKQAEERAARETEIAAVVAAGTNVFRKLGSDWVIEGPGLIAGQTVTVTKKDGETVERVVKNVTEVEGGRRQVATFGFVPDPQREPKARLFFPQVRRSSGRCDQCGGGGAAIERHDSSGISGMVCDRCNRNNDDLMLSFA